MVGWTAFDEAALHVLSGEPKRWRGTGASVRQFCGTCGTGLFFHNPELLPGIVDVQTATLDEADAFAPQAHIQVAERLSWMADTASLPEFARFPGA